MLREWTLVNFYILVIQGFWNNGQLENLTPVQKVMTSCCFDLYLENETWYEFRVIMEPVEEGVIDFFAPYELR